MQIKPADQCRFDVLSLGEVMLRLDPGEGRISSARSFNVWEGGGEYNVARGLSRCFGLRAALVSAFAKNDVGRLIESLIFAGGVDMSLVKWVEYDGIGRSVRNGLNFTERGFGVRGAKGTSDRGHSAASQLKPGDVDWEYIFGELGVRWFHTGGIFAGLSQTTPALIVDALHCAKKHGTVTSYDLNYRHSLWSHHGGRDACQEVNLRIAPWVDVMIGNEEDFGVCLGQNVGAVDHALRNLQLENYQFMIADVTNQFPNFRVVATSLRSVKTASTNDWSGICWYDGRLHQSIIREDLEILDRVGGGDSFASGLIFGFLETGDATKAVEYGAAHGALAMTTPGDNSMVTRQEVESLISGKPPRARR